MFETSHRHWIRNFRMEKGRQWYDAAKDNCMQRLNRYLRVQRAVRCYLTFDWRTLLCTTNFGFRVRESNLMKKPPPALRSLSLSRSSSAVQYCDFLFAVQTDSWSSRLFKKWAALAAKNDTLPRESLSDRIFNQAVLVKLATGIVL